MENSFQDMLELTNVEKTEISEYFGNITKKLYSRINSSTSSENRKFLKSQCDIITEEIYNNGTLLDLNTVKEKIKLRFKASIKEAFEKDYENLPNIYKTVV